MWWWPPHPLLKTMHLTWCTYLYAPGNAIPYSAIPAQCCGTWTPHLVALPSAAPGWPCPDRPQQGRALQRKAKIETKVDACLAGSPTYRHIHPRYLPPIADRTARSTTESSSTTQVRDHKHTTGDRIGPVMPPHHPIKANGRWWCAPAHLRDRRSDISKPQPISQANPLFSEP